MPLSTIGAEVLEKLCKEAGQPESLAVSALLEGLPTEQGLDIDQAVGAYVATVQEAAFLAGLAVGRDPWAMLVHE
mgnify:CR=1 FL=1